MIKLFDAGLSTLLISVYDGPKEEKEFYNLCKEVGLREDQYVIRNRYMPEESSFGLNISNRSGTLSNAEYKIPALKKSLNKKCNYPAYTFFIDYNGEVQMCSHDWAKKYVLGNVNKQNIIDIWLNQKFQFARKKLLLADRDFSRVINVMFWELIGLNMLMNGKKINEKLVKKIIDQVQILLIDQNI